MIKMKTKAILAAMVAAYGLSTQAQTLEKMQWLNEPASYTIQKGTLEMDVPAQTHFWRIAHFRIGV